ncbi:MAG: RtcB family protein, partial [Candidatus Paceibacterales bacterium]
MEKRDFKKLSDWLWEIPKSFRSDMRVPARIYVSEKMLEDVFRDRSIGQLVNIATLPGIVKYSLAMPDMHEGYASPIGGVAAIRISDGVISPGVCLKGNTKVLHSLGYYLPIKEFEGNKPSEEVRCAGFKGKDMEEGSISRFFKIKTNPHILKVVTKTGRKVEATPDHPFYTPKGMTKLEELNARDKIALYPFQGIEYQSPSDRVLVNKREIKEKAKGLNQNPAGHGIEQIINRLKEKNLLPLKTNSSQFPYLLKIMGYALGDGTMYFESKRKRGQICFHGKPEDLKQVQKDIKKVGFRTTKILSRKRNHTIKTPYSLYRFSNTEYSLRVGSSSLVLLLWVLGMPIGNKTNQDWVLPSWLFELPLWQKRLFLAAFFGAELSSPKTVTNHGFNFYSPVLGINKNEKYIKSGRRFLIQIAKILEEFGIKKRRVIQRKDYINNKNKVSYRIRLTLSSKPQNLINLWGKIGYEYHREKQFLANLAVHFIKSKQKFIESKILSRGIKSRKGLVKFQKSQIDFLRNLIKKGGKNLARPFVGQFPIFKEFIKIATKRLGKSGMVWDEIERIEKVPFRGYVYDFTVNHPDHNFIANNFVVSNCG